MIPHVGGSAPSQPRNGRRDAALALVRSSEQLDYTAEVAEIAEVYSRHKLMPHQVVGDADQLALASLRGCDMVVT